MTDSEYNRAARLVDILVQEIRKKIANRILLARMNEEQEELIRTLLAENMRFWK